MVKVNSKYRDFIFVLIMSSIMTFLMAGVMTYINPYDIICHRQEWKYPLISTMEVTNQRTSAKWGTTGQLVITCANKLLHHIYAILKKGQPYQA
jgi:hypothetical protein